MIAACAAAGLPEPEFAELGFRFRVTIRTEGITEPALDRVEDRIVIDSNSILVKVVSLASGGMAIGRRGGCALPCGEAAGPGRSEDGP